MKGQPSTSLVNRIPSERTDDCAVIAPGGFSAFIFPIDRADAWSKLGLWAVRESVKRSGPRRTPTNSAWILLAPSALSGFERKGIWAKVKESHPRQAGSLRWLPSEGHALSTISASKAWCPFISQRQNSRRVDRNHSYPRKKNPWFPHPAPKSTQRALAQGVRWWWRRQTDSPRGPASWWSRVTLSSLLALHRLNFLICKMGMRLNWLLVKKRTRPVLSRFVNLENATQRVCPL